MAWPLTTASLHSSVGPVDDGAIELTCTLDFSASSCFSSFYFEQFVSIAVKKNVCVFCVIWCDLVCFGVSVCVCVCVVGKITWGSFFFVFVFSSVRGRPIPPIFVHDSRGLFTRKVFEVRRVNFGHALVVLPVGGGKHGQNKR